MQWRMELVSLDTTRVFPKFGPWPLEDSFWHGYCHGYHSPASGPSQSKANIQYNNPCCFQFDFYNLLPAEFQVQNIGKITGSGEAGTLQLSPMSLAMADTVGLPFNSLRATTPSRILSSPLTGADDGAHGLLQ